MDKSVDDFIVEFHYCNEQAVIISKLDSSKVELHFNEFNEQVKYSQEWFHTRCY